MNREQFAALLEKYQEGRCTDAEKQLVEHWFGLLENENASDTPDDATDAAAERIWAGMQEQTDLPDFQHAPRSNPFRSVYLRWGAIAASVLLMGWLVSRRLPGRDIPLAAYAWEEQRNDGTSVMPVLLEDSSTVELEPGSALRYPSNFEAGRRVVILKGNAFFSIRKNPKRPFLVHAGSVTTRVLGTSFHVGTAANGRQTTVEVVTGLVSVSAGSTDDARADLLVTPNHTATFDRTSGKLSPGIAEKPRLLNPSVSFRFQNSPLSEVAAHMREAWGVEFQTDNEQIRNCPLTADLSGQPLFVQMDIICAALGARYKVRGPAIRISGPGCRPRGTQAYQTRKPSHRNMQT